MTDWDRELYLNLQPYRGRSLADLEKRVGDITGPIDGLVRSRKRPRVLEVGHGFGSVLVQLMKRYGSGIELHAISDQEYWGSWDVVRRNALDLNLVEESELLAVEPPTIHTADVNAGLPFRSGHFDFIYSQVSFFLLREKLFFLEECSRVLAAGSVAWIDVYPLKGRNAPAELCMLLDIRTDQGSIDFWAFTEKFSWLSRRTASMRDYLEVRRHDHPRLNATLASAVDLNKLCGDWYGMRSIYHVPS
jgi:SAM-dependent methyltransferase